MSKYALLADTHLGLRSDSPHFDEAARVFFQSFFQFLKRHKITKIIHFGDLVDRRKYLNIQTWTNFKKYFLDELKKSGISMYVLMGNHDTYYKNTNEVNSLELLLDGAVGTYVVSKPTTIELAPGYSVLMLPWICEENAASVVDAINQSEAKECFGHLELVGFQMDKGNVCEEGTNPEFFQKFDRVLTGHFHHRHTKGNVTYLGCPYEMTWVDYGDDKGFHVLDTDTKEIEFIRNPNRMFHIINYDDSKEQSLSAKDYAGKIVKLVVVKKDDTERYEMFVDSLYNAGVLDLKIIEDGTDIFVDDNDDGIVVEDTMTLLSEFVKTSPDIDTTKKDKLVSIFRTLYVEAQNMDQQ
jgi:DNA repair exonuclease SbcCD nuclease subunit